jgi:hypothetical protein
VPGCLQAGFAQALYRIAKRLRVNFDLTLIKKVAQSHLLYSQTGTLPDKLIREPQKSTRDDTPETRKTQPEE